MKNAKAFTLVELLVVISIIAVLLAVLMPALNKAKEHGRMVVCRNNVKALVLGSNLWSNEHDGWVIAGDWFKDPGDNGTESSLGPYIGATDKGKKGSVKVCPTAVHGNFFRTDTAFNSDATRYTYAVNGYLSFNLGKSPGRMGPSGRGSGGICGLNDVYWTEHGLNKLTDIKNPARIVYFIDHEYYFACDWTFNPTKSISELTRNTPDKNYKFITRWHQKRINQEYGVGNIGWVDGHVSVEPGDFAKKDGSTELWRKYFYR